MRQIHASGFVKSAPVNFEFIQNNDRHRQVSSSLQLPPRKQTQFVNYISGARSTGQPVRPSAKTSSSLPQRHMAVPPKQVTHASPARYTQTRQTTSVAYTATQQVPQKHLSKHAKDTQAATVSQKHSGWQSKILYGMATILFVLGVAVAFTGLRANDKVAAQVKTMQKKSTSQPGGAAAAGALPSADRPSDESIRSYTVAPDMPKYISIPKQGVYARVFPMGVNDKSQLDTPNNIHDAGWYNGSSMPGKPGAMLIDGHSGIGKTNGVFHNVARLQKGDKIVVTRGDGQELTYTIATVTVLKVDAVDMTNMVTPANGASEGINIITCTGKLIPGTTSLDQRVLVRATRN